MQSLLFAYGTLMPSVAMRMGRPERARLARQSSPLGGASMQGRLYDLGQYPGLTLSDHRDDVVHGELLELSDPAATLRWLDAYEGIVPGDHEHNAYVRLLCPVVRPDAGACEAWVYVYKGDLSRVRRIEDGRWPPTEGAQ
ncbi:MAG: gamma-glutamylcyclotransferase [Hyphomicrobiaceae bacterium]